jgi:hypothetical protein
MADRRASLAGMLPLTTVVSSPWQLFGVLPRSARDEG